MRSQNIDSRPTRRDFLGATGSLALAAGAATATAVGRPVEALAGSGADDQSPDAPAPTGEPARPGRHGSEGKQVIPGSPSPAYSRAVRHDRIVFVAGCVGTYQKDGKSTIDPDFRRQAEQTLKNLRASIEASGSTLDNVLKCTCFLKEYADFKAFNEVYMTVFTKNPPARSTVVVKDFVVPGALLEVDCVCCVD